MRMSGRASAGMAWPNVSAAVAFTWGARSAPSPDDAAAGG